MNHEAPLVHGTRNCNLPELPAVISTSGAFGGDFSASYLIAHAGAYLGAEGPNSATTVPFPDNHFGRSPAFLSSFVSAPPSVLRI
jgi:hypothetical protein